MPRKPDAFALFDSILNMLLDRTAISDVLHDVLQTDEEDPADNADE